MPLDLQFDQPRRMGSEHRREHRFLYGELPSNPGQAFFDLGALAELAHAHGLPLIVDSTVATPALLRPLQHGADVVVQSVTKTLTSSGFGIAGAVIARKDLAAAPVRTR